MAGRAKGPEHLQPPANSQQFIIITAVLRLALIMMGLAYLHQPGPVRRMDYSTSKSNYPKQL